MEFEEGEDQMEFSKDDVPMLRTVSVHWKSSTPFRVYKEEYMKAKLAIGGDFDPGVIPSEINTSWGRMSPEVKGEYKRTELVRKQFLCRVKKAIRFKPVHISDLELFLYTKKKEAMKKHPHCKSPGLEKILREEFKSLSPGQKAHYKKDFELEKLEKKLKKRLKKILISLGEDESSPSSTSGSSNENTRSGSSEPPLVAWKKSTELNVHFEKFMANVADDIHEGRLTKKDAVARVKLSKRRLPEDEQEKLYVMSLKRRRMLKKANAGLIPDAFFMKATLSILKFIPRKIMSAYVVLA